MARRRGRLFGPDAVDYQSQYYGKKERTEAQKKSQMENLKKAQEALRQIRSGEEEALFKKLLNYNAPTQYTGKQAHDNYAAFIERIGDSKGKLMRTYASDEILEAEAMTRAAGVSMTKGRAKRFIEYIARHTFDKPEDDEINEDMPF